MSRNNKKKRQANSTKNYHNAETLRNGKNRFTSETVEHSKDEFAHSETSHDSNTAAASVNNVQDPEHESIVGEVPEMSATTKSMTSILDEFTHNINSLLVSYDIISSFTRFLSTHNGDRFNEFLKKRGTAVNLTPEEIAYTVPIFWRRTADKLQSNYDKLKTAHSIVPESLLVSLVSQYDAFLGALTRNLFYLKPELLNESERAITFKELVSYDSLDKAREHIINEELNTLLRKSHHEQFLWLENKLKLQLRKDLDVYPSFIELTERRNLLVHAKGVVSPQYCDECKTHGYKLPEHVKPGSKLDVDREYFGKSANCLIELAIKLAHVTFRKLEKDSLQLALADSELNTIILDLITNQEYELSINLGAFFANEKAFKFVERESEYILTLNLAQSYKWLGDEDNCKETLLKHDWKCMEIKYKFAWQLLCSNFKGAYATWRSIGSNTSLLPKEYIVAWPIYQELRRHKDFIATFKEIYGEEYLAISEEHKTIIGILEPPSSIISDDFESNS